MKKLFALLTVAIIPFLSISQVNMDSLGYLDLPTLHSTELNDIWGYTDENGNEYALVGCTNGTSVVDVTDPANPTEIAWFPGVTSIWRDIKVYSDYAYVSTETADALFIIDLTPLPGSTILPTTTYNGPVGNQWTKAHNLYQADGYLYVFGANRDNGGAIILDVATDPMNPIEVGAYEEYYIHDGFVKNDTGYFAHVSDGFFTIVDLTDKSNVGLPEIIGSMSTPGTFTHNCWLSDDSQTLFTTDEITNGFISSYDISDPTTPVYLDQIQSSPGNNLIPHNVHVLNNLLVTSYYTDGVVVHDISDPANIVEVGYYDTSPNFSGSTFNGCWGAYPFFTSGNIVASDTEEGLYVLGLNPTLACYLEGNVSNFGTGQGINGALIEILTTAITDNTDALGDYSFSTTNTGLFQVRYSAPGFFADTFDITFVTGTIINQNVQLVQIPLFNATITVIDATTLSPVQGAEVMLEHTLQNFEGTTDVNGEVTFGLFFEDTYDITGGKWLFVNDCDQNVTLNLTTTTHQLEINPGLYDDFTFDFGWTAFGGASAGFWERDVPNGTQAAGITSNPFNDNLFDCSNFAYITGNAGGSVGNDDIDGGSVELKSPVFDLSGYANPQIDFSYWFFNGFGGGSPNDSLAIYMSNGTGIVQVASLGEADNTSTWTNMSIKVIDYLSATNQMQLTFLATDFSPGHVTEAGVDYFRVSELSTAGVSDPLSTYTPKATIYPNPAEDQIILVGVEKAQIEIFDVSGRLVQSDEITGSLNISNLNSGMYIIHLYNTSGELILVQKQQIR
jgi:choice-of-anchor B domain-containing protein